MPSGRFVRRMPPSSGRLTPPWSTVRPSTNDSGMPSRIEPSTMAWGEPSPCLPVGSFRFAPPRRSRSQSPAAKAAAPTSRSRATHASDCVSSASSINSNDTEPISRPVPSAITTAINLRPGRNS